MGADAPRDDHGRGLIDTNILILRAHIPASELPDELAISAVTLAELCAGVHLVVGDDVVAGRERAARMDVLQRAEHEFHPLPFDASAARAYGRICAAVAGIGRQPRRRVADLQIAAVACANDLPLFTTSPGNFVGVDELVTVVGITRPGIPRRPS
ncbi:MAG: type II toxin-antitoxin system VapC family toxin [Dermatophilaceae bacterium]